MLDRLDKDVTVDKEAVFCAEGAANNMMACVVGPGRVSHRRDRNIEGTKWFAKSRQNNKSNRPILMRPGDRNATQGIIISHGALPPSLTPFLPPSLPLAYVV